MKKILPFITLNLFLSLISHAQPKVSYSELFRDPGTQWKVLLPLENGNTLFINYADPEIKLVVYNKEHIRIADNDLRTDMYKQSGNTIINMFASGDMLVFLNEYADTDKVVLQRFLADPMTGKVTKPEDLSQFSLPATYHDTLEMKQRNFSVVHDPLTKGYAILSFDRYHDDNQKIAGIQVFDNANRLLKKATLSHNDFKGGIRVSSMYMYNNDVFLCTHDYDMKLYGRQVPTYISILHNNADSFVTGKIDIEPCKTYSIEYLMYNPGSKHLELVTSTRNTTPAAAKHYPAVIYFNTMISHIDPTTLNMLSSVSYATPKADAYVKQKMGLSEFDGALPYITCNSVHTSIMMPVNTQRLELWNNFPEKIGFIYLDSTGREKDAYVLRMPQPNYAFAQAGKALLRPDLLCTAAGDYVIYNDLPSNVLRDEKKHPKKLTLQTAANLNTVICKLVNGNPERSYLFGMPNNDAPSKYIYPESGVYDIKNNTYAVVMVENTTEHKESRIAWVKFD